MEKRFLFDRINLDTRSIAEWNEELAVAVEANFANAVFPGSDLASVSAGKTAYPVVRKFFV
jgi:hypothetical protein